MVLERLRRALSSLHSQIIDVLFKAFFVLLFAFSLYVVIKHVHEFTAMAQENMSDAEKDLALADIPNQERQSTSSSTIKSFLTVLMSIGKVLIVGTTMFFSLFISEANSQLPLTVICFAYGLIVGFAWCYFRYKNRFTWSKNRAPFTSFATGLSSSSSSSLSSFGLGKLTSKSKKRAKKKREKREQAEEKV